MPRESRQQPRLSSRELEALARLADVPPDTLTGQRLESALGSDAVEEAIFAPDEHEPVAPLLHVTPRLVFAVAVHRAAATVGQQRYVEEWVGPGQRLPVFASAELAEVLGEPWQRWFLVDLLASYVRVASGRVWSRGPRGPRKRRFSELDPLSLVSLLEDAREEERPRLYRRLGDLALFLTGVFPDHTATRWFRPVDAQRLAWTLGRETAEELADDLASRGAVGLLEVLGARWYAAAARLAPGGALRDLGELSERFVDVRRALNHVTDRYLLPVRRNLFPGAA